MQGNKPHHTQHEFTYQRQSLLSHGYVANALRHAPAHAASRYWDYILGRKESEQATAFCRARHNDTISHDAVTQPHEGERPQQTVNVVDRVRYSNKPARADRACVLDYIVPPNIGIIVPIMNGLPDYAQLQRYRIMHTPRGNIVSWNEVNRHGNETGRVTLVNYRPPLMVPHFFHAANGAVGVTDDESFDSRLMLYPTSRVNLSGYEGSCQAVMQVEWPGYGVYKHICTWDYQRDTTMWQVSRMVWEAIRNFFERIKGHPPALGFEGWNVAQIVPHRDIKIIGIMQVDIDVWRVIMQLPGGSLPVQ